MTEVSFFEQSTSQEFEDKIRRSVGLAFIKPDSIELGVEDFLIEHITKKINEHSKIDLVGGIVLENLTEKDVGRIYPYLDEKIFRGYVSLLAQSQEILLIFEAREPTVDLWSKLKEIRGFINKGNGFNDSVRSAIPLPSQRRQFDLTTQHIKDNKLDESDYRQMARNLLHIPDDVYEFAGLFSLIPMEELKKIFDNDKARVLSERLSSFVINRAK